jgi:hypothetical protein
MVVGKREKRQEQVEEFSSKNLERPFKDGEAGGRVGEYGKYSIHVQNLHTQRTPARSDISGMLDLAVT